MTLPVVFTANGQVGYNLTKSLRFRSSASAYLNRTPASAGNRKTMTFSFWVKRGLMSSTQQNMISAGTGGDNYIAWSSTNDYIEMNFRNGGSASNVFLITTQVFRDPSAWYHIVLAIDTTQATASNRVKLYVNGSQVTAFGTTTYPTQNNDLNGFNNNVIHHIGQSGVGGFNFYLDGYLAEVNFIDGQALTPSSFGETSTTTGVWQPKKYTGTYGTNGLYLPFTDTISTSTLGTDFSGNSNTWTVNNISLTSGSTYDSMTDVPTLTSATTANYCVLSPLDYYSPYLNAPTEGNLKQSNTTGSAWGINRSTIGITSGKWYVEVTQTGSNLFAGVVSGSTSLTFPLFTGSSGLYAFFNNGAGTTGYPYANGTSGTVFTIASGDVIGLAYDYDAQTLAIYRNNSLQATVTSIPKTEPMFFCAAFAQTTATTSWNFGQRPFAYTPPTGFVALNTFNLPTPTIGATASTTANKYMDVTTYTGNSTAGRVITMSNMTNVGFAWVKIRSGADDHRLANTVTGGNRHLQSNTTAAEGTGTNIIQAFSSNTFTVGSDNSVNVSGSTYVGWVWANDGTSGSTNTAGSITSTVSANTTAGFSVVTYTGTGANATVGHGLGVAPSMIIARGRSAGTAGFNWRVYHGSLSATQYLEINLTSAVQTDATVWNSTAPTSSVFSLGSSGNVNGSTQTFVAYCFAPIAGYSAFGSYTGNGSSDGPFIFTGFRPRYVLIKTSSAGTNGWQIRDTSRSPYNTSLQLLYADTSNAEISSAGNDFDILSNGFKVRNSGGDLNTNGGTYIYACFAENPFKYSNAR